MKAEKENKEDNKNKENSENKESNENKENNKNKENDENKESNENKEDNERKQGLSDQIIKSFGKEKQDTNFLSPLNLAYIGDAIYEVVIRTAVLEEGNAPVNKLNAKAREFVKAESQAVLMRNLLQAEFLTEKELSVYKRGRNAKSNTSAKNASLQDYRTATGFEALLGYCYLEGQMERLLDIIQKAAELAGFQL